MKIVSWNVNGMRAVWNKGAIQDFIKKESPDILAIQEIKCTEEQLSDEQKTLTFPGATHRYTALFESARNFSHALSYDS
jgi:exonuclease III